METRRIRFSPESQRELQRGIDLLEQTLGPTIGPRGRSVAVARIGRPNQLPELLDDGATISRRITGLPERFPNMGLMLARHVAWRQHMQAGDGSATAVVLLAAAFRQLCHFAAAGADRVALRRGAEEAVAQATRRIAAATTPLAGDEIARYAATMAADPTVALVTAEALTLLGPETVVVTRESTGRTVTLECIEGALWESTSVLAPLAGIAPTSEVRLSWPRILIWDGTLDDPRLLAAALGQLRAGEANAVVLVARSFSPDVLAVLSRNSDAGFQLVPVTAPHAGLQQEWALRDMAVLAGGRVLTPVGGDALDRLDSATIGRVRRAVIGSRFVNFLAADEVEAAVTRQAELVRQLMDRATDEPEWKRLALRLGRLRQGMGVIWIGAPTASERTHRLHTTDQTLGSLRAAIAGGVVPGGGATLLGLSRCLTPSGRSDEELGILAVARGLAAPAWWIARNAGLSPDWAVHRATPEAPEHGIDGIGGGMCELRPAGILDPAPTLVHALRTGILTAAQAITCDVLIHRPRGLTQAEMNP